MDILASMHALGHEQVLLSHDPSCGYFGIIAIHDTTLGPALGGTRFWQLRLDRRGDHGRAPAGPRHDVQVGRDGDQSGRRQVGHRGRQQAAAIARRCSAPTAGSSRRWAAATSRRRTSEPVPADMEYIKLETDHVAGLVGLCGDPSPVTAYGVYVGMKAAAKGGWGSDSLAGKTVAVQGCGKVATHLCRPPPRGGRQADRHRHRRAKRSKRVVAETGRQVGGPGRDLRRQAADVYAPCALGATINDDTLARLKVEVIAGGANNQLAEDRHGDLLEQRGILYAPDYVINGGGRDQRLRRAAPLAAGALQEEGGGDLRHAAPDLRDRQAGADPDLPRGRPVGRGAGRGGGGAGPDVDGGRQGRR